MARYEFNGKQLDLSHPVVMGILNVSPDSFYDGGKYPDLATQVEQAGRMLDAGAAIIDIGGISTRPGAPEVDEEDELLRVMPALNIILKIYPDCLVSVDTYRPSIAKTAAEHGAFMINDIYGGMYDPKMLPLIAKLNIPYVVMHMKGSPQNMQADPQYGDVVAEISYFFDAQLRKLEEMGFRKLILDPGFGFGKTIGHNFEVLSRFPEFTYHGYPLMAGLSRKSMISRVLGTDPADTLNGTTVLNTVALLKGASILRVHDVKEAMEAIKLVGRIGQTEIP
jgi:dihydropteroate synthase